MKKISLPEFRDYFSTQSFDKIIFSSDNQPYSIDCTLFAEFVFQKMIITFNPNIIHLMSKENILQFNKVKAIKFPKGDCLLGKVFVIVCGDLKSNVNDKEYTLIAS